MDGLVGILWNEMGLKKEIFNGCGEAKSDLVLERDPGILAVTNRNDDETEEDDMFLSFGAGTSSFRNTENERNSEP